MEKGPDLISRQRTSLAEKGKEYKHILITLDYCATRACVHMRMMGGEQREGIEHRKMTAEARG